MYAPHAHLHRVVCRRSSFSSLVFLNRRGASACSLSLSFSSCRREQIEEQYHIIVDDNDVVCMVSCVVFSSFFFILLYVIDFFLLLLARSRLHIHTYLHPTSTITGEEKKSNDIIIVAINLKDRDFFYLILTLE